MRSNAFGVVEGELHCVTGFCRWTSFYASTEAGVLSIYAAAMEEEEGEQNQPPLAQIDLSSAAVKPMRFACKKHAFRVSGTIVSTPHLAKRSRLDRGGWVGLAGSTAEEMEAWISACVANGASDSRMGNVSNREESQEALLKGLGPASDAALHIKQERRLRVLNERDSELKAARMLQRLVRKVLRKRVEKCSPITFRTAPPFTGRALIADWGRITFGGRMFGGKPLPYFIHLASDRKPFLTQDQYTNSIINMLERHWGVGKATVVISITGSAQDFDMPQRLLKAFKQGLVKAALATNALIVTGGTDSGVMQIAGKAIAEYDAHVPVIGIATWGTVLKRHNLVGCNGDVSDMTPEMKNSKEGGNLEPNHTHFLLIDNGKEGSSAWGGEISFRNSFESEYCRSRSVPRALLVVQGGPGTLSTVLYAVESECPVVLVADSGGVAELLHVFLEAYNDTSSTHYKKGIIPPKFEAMYSSRADMLLRIAEANSGTGRITAFSLSQNQTAELDLHLLNAVINDTAQCKPESRLKLAVEWNRVDVVQRVMADGGQLNMREAVQCAVMNQRIDIIKLLLAHDSSIVQELDVIELYRSLLYTERIFRNSATFTEQLESPLAYSARNTPTTVFLYTTLLVPFLKEYFPGLEERCDSTPHPRKARLTVDDIFIWAVLIGNFELAELTWLAGATATAEPIRLALLAAYASRKAANIDITEETRYLDNAARYEQWAFAVLSKCESHEDATWVLRRPSEEGWPHSLMHVATQTNSKLFVGHRYVQTIVDESFRGNMSGSSWALPQEGCPHRHAVLDTADSLGVADHTHGSLFHEPRKIKFLFARLSYFCYCINYFLYITKRSADLMENRMEMTFEDWIFFGWSFTLLLDELHQWIDDARKGDWRSHFASFANVIDVGMWTLLALANALRFYASYACDSLLPSRERALGAVEWEYRPARFELPYAAHAVRSLRGSDFGDDADDDADAPAHGILYEGSCLSQDFSHVILSTVVILAVIRPIDAFLVNRKFGVLSIIMMRLKDDILVFITYAFMFIVAFGTAFVGLMPGLGDGPFAVNGAFYVPFWSMYGEFGDLADVGAAGGWLSTSLLWLYTFAAQIVLVNLLIAMMTETYESVKENADNEWRFQRVSTIDEAASAPAIPPPLSLPILLVEMVQELMRYFFSFEFNSRLVDIGKIGSLSLFDMMDKEKRVGNPRPDLVWLTNLGDEWASRRKNDQRLHLEELKMMGESTYAKLLENQACEILLGLAGGRNAGAMAPPTRSNAGASSIAEEQLRARLKDANEVSKKREDEIRKLKAMMTEIETKEQTESADLKQSALLLQEERQANALMRAELERLSVTLQGRAHQRARTPHPKYPARAVVPNHLVSWSVMWRDYAPVEFTDDSILKQEDDTSDAHKVDWNAVYSAEGTLIFNAKSRPLNPRGRTGIAGRGLLPHWGPNFLSFPIVTRYEPTSGQLEVMAILQSNAEWILPSGPISTLQETHHSTIARELSDVLTERASGSALVSDLFRTSTLVFQGYLDDTRNTDHAWLECNAYHFHCSVELAHLLPLSRRDNVVSTLPVWIDVNESNSRFMKLIDTQRKWVQMAVKQSRLPTKEVRESRARLSAVS
ncbi:hypothetical protein AB1Y20_022976 [Prymnesium parvum]|uniref:Uncharacterized protein n=1 Tax=Prymnesium parvum TaxID=97485 RepID=A0AB34JCJ2_PRYPA